MEIWGEQGAESEDHVLTRRSPRGAFPFLFRRALVVEKGLAVCCWRAEVTGPRGDLVSLLRRLTMGRAGVCEMGIRKTFAREASTGERGRMVGGCGLGDWGSGWFP